MTVECGRGSFYKQQTTVILFATVCVKWHTKPSPASERRLLFFLHLALSLSMAYKSVDVCARPRVWVCIHSTAQCFSVLYASAGEKKKGRNKSAGANEEELPAHSRTAGSTPNPSCPGLADSFRPVPTILRLQGDGPDKVTNMDQPGVNSSMISSQGAKGRQGSGFRRKKANPGINVCIGRWCSQYSLNITVSCCRGTKKSVAAKHVYYKYSCIRSGRQIWSCTIRINSELVNPCRIAVWRKVFQIPIFFFFSFSVICSLHYPHNTSRKDIVNVKQPFWKIFIFCKAFQWASITVFSALYLNYANLKALNFLKY
ncbi:uncharacterized protein LOC119124631 [Syngnathus acus]|uniref:uncharacterized protein LOC119124631 n=1 Tax=Syngnathus acus TaxID=161584 RepID=UPI0018864963|nr:uncharacterized protein LOC119124631 [Syngnathus acus]